MLSSQVAESQETGVSKLTITQPDDWRALHAHPDLRTRMLAVPEQSVCPVHELSHLSCPLIPASASACLAARGRSSFFAFWSAALRLSER